MKNIWVAMLKIGLVLGLLACGPTSTQTEVSHQPQAQEYWEH